MANLTHWNKGKKKFKFLILVNWNVTLEMEIVNFQFSVLASFSILVCFLQFWLEIKMSSNIRMPFEIVSCGINALYKA